MTRAAGPDSPTGPLIAGGVVVTRQGLRGWEVLIVHRKRRNDWSLAKGKVHLGEAVASAAVREVWEETGVRVRLGAPLDAVRYDLPDGPKIVQFWSGTVVDAVRRAPDDEVDVVSWLPIRAATARLTYPTDRALVEQHLDQPPTTPLVLVRHAKAMQRKYWVGPDPARPMDALGRRQALQLVPLLGAYGIGQVISSSANRCVQTVHPYAASRDVAVERLDALTEEQGERHPAEVSRLMRRIRTDVGRLATPTVVCGHRPVLPLMLDAVGLPDRPFKTADCTVAHLTGDGATHAVERHRPIV